MNRNVTLSAEDRLIDLARERAKSRRTTLNDEFRRWLESYTCASDDGAVTKLRAVMDRLAHVDAGRTFTRDERNAR